MGNETEYGDIITQGAFINRKRDGVWRYMYEYENQIKVGEMIFVNGKIINNQDS